MGLARIAIAVIAVVVAFGLLIIGGIALWGALTSKDDEKPGAVPSTTASLASSSKPKATSGQVGNTVLIHCLAVQCSVSVLGPGPTNVLFHGTLVQGQRQSYNETQLTVVVDDASSATVTINGKLQPRGAHGVSKTYEVPAGQ